MFRKSSATLWLLLALALVFGWRQLSQAPAPSSMPAVAARAAPQTSASLADPAVDRIIAARRRPASAPSPTLPPFLPPEADAVITRIQRGGPYPYPQDGSTFGNYEGHLPRQPRGWYHEYTVPTPGLSHRGMRRIVTGGNPPRAWYYSADHYRSFRQFDVQGGRP